MTHVTLVPAYGRDYKSKAAVLADWKAGMDFRIASFGPDDDRYASIHDLAGKSVNIRYDKLRKVCVI